MRGANQQAQESFWAWFFRSGRRDGAVVSLPRRILGIIATLAVVVLLYAAWFALVATTIPNTSLFLDSVFIAGIVMAFALLRLRYAVLDYLAFRLFQRENVQLLRGCDEGQLRQRYEATFGRDTLYRAPELISVLGLVIFAVTGFVVVFLRRY
ncbi:MAG TPA: hypothetical protein VD837_04050 [Terriglobales bacterium]|nr:hypothetical protein [Terriglobales bacterium]